MTLALVLLSGLSASCDWWSVARSRTALERIAKPLTMALMTAAALSAGILASGPGLWFTAGMLLGLLGDIALLGQKKIHFMTGLGFFLLGHIAYVISLAQLRDGQMGMALAGLALVAAAFIVMRSSFVALWKNFGSGLGISCIVYALTIAAMVLLAWLTSSWLCAIGASIFMASDALLSSGIARRGFDEDNPRERTIVMVTYHIGQGLLAAGIISLVA
ncbi:lysoplasmalogenase [Glutamicibacter sp.]|uniref:lysoplasmalogenase n=1 Tax=Glutamicibacter sp. TaxID=1931995 RepID=UPI0028BF3D7C|nr:lysoplasmalogenase [Glutamicibacter sp.]